MEHNRGGRPRHPDVLTPAEWRVLEALREGGTNAEIAARLGVSTNTVRYHVSNMLAKLELRDRRALAAWRPDGHRGRLGALLALPVAVWSVGRPLAWIGVGAAVLAGVVVVAVALVALDAIVERDPDPPAAVAPPPSATATPSPTPTVAPTASPTPSPSPSPTPTSTATPAPTPTATPTATPSPSPSPTPTPAANEPAVDASQASEVVLARLPPSPVFDTPDGLYTAIAVGAEHACALSEAGEAVCWNIEDGEVWDTPGGPYTSITAIYEGMCATTITGAIVCWAAGGGPIAEDAPDPSRDAPPGSYGVIRATGGYYCALDEVGEAVYVAITFGHVDHAGEYILEACAARAHGGFVCWRSSSRHAPDVEVEPWEVEGDVSQPLIDGDFCELGGYRIDCSSTYAGRYTAISRGVDNTCAITADGVAECWAPDPLAHDLGSLTVMRPPDPAPGRYVAISVGSTYGCALIEAGGAACWKSQRNVVPPPDPPPGRYVSVSAGRNHTCALTEDGAAVCWGWNNRGQLEVPPGRYTAISAGNLHTCAVTESSEAVCWGMISADPPEGRYAAIQAGGRDIAHACALALEGEAVCWGTSLRDAEPPPGPYTSIGVGESKLCGLTPVGSIVCWSSYDRLRTSGRAYLAIDVGDRVCAIAASGGVVCFDRWSRPYDVSLPQSSYTAVAVGFQHACALDAAGQAACWAWPSTRDPKLEVPEPSPYEDQLTQPPPGPFIAISSSEFRSCAVTADRDVVCWGDVDYAELPEEIMLV